MKTHEYQGFTLESDEELYFAWWCQELFEKEMINTWKKVTDSINIAPRFTKPWTKVTELKTKIKYENKNQVILEGLSYTPDFDIIWSEKAEGIFFQDIDIEGRIVAPLLAQNILWDELCSLVEVKPVFDQNNMTREFKKIQKVLFEYRNTFVNLVFPEKLFKATFTPERYLWTDKKKQKRKITKWKPISFEEFYNKRKNAQISNI